MLKRIAQELTAFDVFLMILIVVFLATGALQ